MHLNIYRAHGPSLCSRCGLARGPAKTTRPASFDEPGNMSTTVTATSTAKRRRLTRDLPSLSIVASDASIRAHTPSVSSASVTSSFRPAELEGRLNRWTRYRSFCSARCIDIAQGLTKRKGQGSELFDCHDLACWLRSWRTGSSLLFYFKDFPCRRAEVVGLVVGVRINSMDVIIYESALSCT